MKTIDLNSTEHPSWFPKYIDLIDNTLSLKEHFTPEGRLISYFKNLPTDKLEYRYEEGKWTPKEVFQHLIDSERVFAHRAFRLGRKDTTPLPSYPHDDYVPVAAANAKSLTALCEEYKVSRAMTRSILNSFSDVQLKYIGTVSDAPLSARAALFLIIGHELWHIKIIEERYL